MPPNESPSVSVSPRVLVPLCSKPLRTVVWVRGEQDASTREQLSVTLAQAAGLDDADLVIDLSGVTFMDASTIGALVVARNRLRVRSRSLVVRDASPRARRLLDLCGLARLIDEHAAPAQPRVATALGSWVEVPARDRGPDSAPPPVAHDAPSPERVCVMARPRVEPSRSIRQHRAPL